MSKFPVGEAWRSLRVCQLCHPQVITRNLVRPWRGQHRAQLRALPTARVPFSICSEEKAKTE